MGKRQCHALLAGWLAAASACAQAGADLVTDEVVVTATRFEDTSADKPVSITVITADDIRKSPARTLPELLGYQAGISGHDLFGNNASQTTVDMRGFGATAAQNTLVLLDGRKMNDIDLSGVQWSALPLDSIERVEIIRGSGAVQYGDGAVAGVINVITRKPGKDGPQATISAGAGSLDTYQARVSGEIGNDTAGLRVGGAYYDSKGYRDNNRDIQSTASAEGRWNAAIGDLSLRFAGADENLRLPGARTVQPSIGLNELESDRKGTSTPKDYALRNDDLLQFDWSRTDGFVSEVVGVSYRKKGQKSYFDFGGFPDYREIDLDVLAFTPRARLDHAGWGVNGNFVIGFDLYRWNYDLALTSSPAAIAQPVHRVDARQDNQALYVLETLMPAKGTTITGGARIEWFRINANDTYDPTAPNPTFISSGSPSGEQNERQFAWELGLRQALTQQWSTFARATRAYRFATVDEIYETTALFETSFQFLKPQTSLTYEIGADWRGEKADARAGIFQTDVKDEVHLDAFTSGVGNTNLPPSRRRGIEVEAGARPAERVDVRLTYTYTDPKFRDGEFPGGPFSITNVNIAGKTVPLVPRHKVALNANWGITPATYLSGAVAYVSDQYMDNDEANDFGTKIPAYTVVDLKLTQQFGALRLGVAVNNALDEKYYNYAVRSQFVPDRYNAYPLPERTFMAFLEYRFGK
ncbi:MAG TPA: TonB-dependent receptor [Burkholderiales bacterium]|nr:TonB-dependent receptor [Burkholderiales bacterium]